MKAFALVPIALAATAAAAALAESPNRLDPNQMICRSELEPGSRLMGHRRCLTRAQWAERSRLDRQYAEKAQTSRTFCGGICPRHMNHGH